MFHISKNFNTKIRAKQIYVYEALIHLSQFGCEFEN